MTTESSALTAARETPLVRCGVTSSSVAWIAIITPSRGSACMSRARSVTSLAASSRLSTPATCAAAISPMEWPATLSALNP